MKNTICTIKINENAQKNITLTPFFLFDKFDIRYIIYLEYFKDFVNLDIDKMLWCVYNKHTIYMIFIYNLCTTDGLRRKLRGNAKITYADRLGNSV